MKDLHSLFSEEFASDLLDDDIDQLYCQLEQIEPPAFLVDSIMTSVARLPQAQAQLQEQPVADGLASSFSGLREFLMHGFGIQLS